MKNSYLSIGRQVLLQMLCLLWLFSPQTAFAQLSGTKTVCTGCDFPTLTGVGGLFSAINTQGLGGNLTVTINGNITETGVYRLFQWTETPALSNYTLTISPNAATMRTLSANFAGSLFDFVGADRVTIDGRFAGAGQFLTFRNTNAGGTASTLAFSNGALLNTVRNVFVEGSGTSTNLGTILLGANGSNIPNSLTVISADIKESTGSIPFNAFRTHGLATTNRNGDLLTVQNCNIYNFSQVGILLGNAADGCNFTNNSFYYNSVTVAAANQTCISIGTTQRTSSGHTISGNFFGGQASSCGGSAWTKTANNFIGISLTIADTNPTLITSNTIQNITTTGANTGITIFGTLATTTIQNNTIGHNSTANSILTSGNFSTTGIFFSTVGGNCIAENNTIANLTCSNTSTSGTVRGIAFVANSAGLPTQFLRFKNNTIHTLTTATSATGNILEGINISTTSTTNAIEVSGNTIHSLIYTNGTAAGSLTGINLAVSTPNNLTTSPTVSNNYIHSFATASTGNTVSRGISTSGTASNFPVEITNNRIRLGINHLGVSITDACSIEGIRAIGFANVYHNTVYIGGTGVGSTTSRDTYALQVGFGSSGYNVRNNILANVRQNATTGSVHYCSAYSFGSTYTEVDYNIYQTATLGNNFLFIFRTLSSNPFNSLQTVRTFLPINIERHSGLGDPKFVLPTGTASTLDLSLQANNPAESNGTPIATVMTDFAGDARNGTTPDIGADEASNALSATDDIFPPLIAYTRATNLATVADNTLANVTIIDNSTGVPTTGGNIPRVWFRNQTTAGLWASAAGSLSSGTGKEGVWSFVIDDAAIAGGYTAGDLVAYYVVAQDQATTPNLMYEAFTGAVHTNVNTQTTPPTTPLTYTMGNTIAGGTYTVGTAGTYTSLTNAGGVFEALNSRTLTGNVVFQINTDLTAESGTNVLRKLSSDAGAYTVTIQSDGTSRLITGTGATEFLTFEGVSGVTIDGGAGKTLTFRTNSAIQTLRFRQGASNITVQDVRIESRNVNTSNTAAIDIRGADNITINNCIVTKEIGQSYGRAVYVQPFDISLRNNDNLTISNCDISDFRLEGIRIEGVANAPNITANKFFQTATQTFTVTTAHIVINANSFNIQGLSIMNNTIGYAANNAMGVYTIGGNPNSIAVAFTGIRALVGVTTASSVQNNTITNFSLSTTNSTAPFTGINILGGWINVGNTTGNTIGSTVVNGAITLSDINNTATVTGISCTGIYHNNAVYLNNNKVGGFNIAPTAAATQVSMRGLTLSAAGLPNTLYIQNNTIGSNTQSNSIQYTTANTAGGNTEGIAVFNVSAGAVNISDNLVANITASPTGNQQSKGYVVVSSSFNTLNVGNNTVHTFLSGTTNTTTTATQGMQLNPTARNILIKGNTIYNIQNTNSNTGAYGVTGLVIPPASASDASSITVRDNVIYALSSASSGTASVPEITGILTSASNTFSSFPVLVYNNRISLGINANGASYTNAHRLIGISYIGTFNTFQAYHNTVYIGGIGVANTPVAHSFAFVTNSSSSIGTIALRNNILLNERANAVLGIANKHYSVFYDTRQPITSDYNIFSSPANDKIPFGRGTVITAVTNYNTLADWQGRFGFDANSAVGNPSLANPTAGTPDLKLQATNSAEGRGTPIASVTTDFEGDARNGTTPDIGADEGSYTVATTTELFAPAIAYTNLSTPLSVPLLPSRTLTATITDRGAGVSTTGGNVPRIYYKNITLAGAWFSQAGTLTSGDGNNGTWDFVINHADLIGYAQGHTVQYYIVAQDQATVPNIGFSPAFGASHTNVNTRTTAPTYPNSYTVSNTASKVRGNSITFVSGSSQRAQIGAIGASPLPASFNTFTMETWMNITTFPGGVFQSTIMGLEENSTVDSYILRTGVGTGNQVEVVIGSTDFGSQITATSPANFLSTNTWYHIATTYDGTTLKLYVDGILVSANVNIMTINPPRTSTFALGGRAQGADRHLNGRLDEARVWRTARTEAEIRANMHLTLNGNEAGLAAYYQFDETLGNVVDVTNGNDLSLMNAPARSASTLTVGYGVSKTVSVTSVGSVIDLTTTNMEIDFSGTSANPNGNLVVTQIMGEKPYNNTTVPAATTSCYWVVRNFGTNTGLAFDNIKFKIPSSNKIDAADETTPSNLKLYHRTTNSGASVWTQIGGIGANSASNTTKEINFNSLTNTSFSEFIVGSVVGALPITLLTFGGERIEQAGERTEAVKLTWTTASEIGNKGFEIQVSDNAQTFKNIAFVEGRGNSTTVSSYQLAVINPNDAYYRLKQIDFDGKFSYSPIVFVEGLVGEVKIYPNPNNGTFTVLVGKGKLDLPARLLNAQGVEVWRGIQTEVKTNLPAGMYFLHTTVAGKTKVTKVVIQ